MGCFFRSLCKKVTNPIFTYGVVSRHSVSKRADIERKKQPMKEMMDKDVVEEIVVQGENIIQVMHVVKMLGNEVAQAVAILMTNKKEQMMTMHFIGGI